MGSIKNCIIREKHLQIKDQIEPINAGNDKVGSRYNTN